MFIHISPEEGYWSTGSAVVHLLSNLIYFGTSIITQAFVLR